MPMEIDWKKAPKGARWWAMDADGDAHWYMAPDFIARTNFWMAEERPAPSFGYEGNWKESLVERPA